MKNWGVVIGVLLLWMVVNEQALWAQGPEAFPLTSFWSSYDVMESRNGAFPMGIVQQASFGRLLFGDLGQGGCGS